MKVHLAIEISPGDALAVGHHLGQRGHASRRAIASWAETLVLTQIKTLDVRPSTLRRTPVRALTLRGHLSNLDPHG